MTYIRKTWRVFYTEDDIDFLKRTELQYRRFYHFSNPQNHYYQEQEGDALEVLTTQEEQEMLVRLYFGERACLASILSSISYESYD